MKTKFENVFKIFISGIQEALSKMVSLNHSYLNSLPCLKHLLTACTKKKNLRGLFPIRLSWNTFHIPFITIHET